MSWDGEAGDLGSRLFSVMQCMFIEREGLWRWMIGPRLGSSSGSNRCGAGIGNVSSNVFSRVGVSWEESFTFAESIGVQFSGITAAPGEQA